MLRKTDQTCPAVLIARTSVIALIAAVVTLGVGISSDGDVSLAVPLTHAQKSAGENDSGGNGGRAGNSAGSNHSPSAPGSSASTSGEGFGGSAKPAGPVLTAAEEQDLISRGWQ